MLVSKPNDGPRTTYLLAERAYFSYFESLLAAWRKRDGGPIEECTPADALANIDRLRAGRLIVTVHSVLPQVFDVLHRLNGSVPTLTLQDGIIEYKHLTHGFRGAKRYRPLRTDYIAAFGARSANLLRAMGVEQDRIFVTGSPRFDSYHDLPRGPVPDGYVLITCANRPAFGIERLVKFYELVSATVLACQRMNLPYRVRLSRGTRPGGIEELAKVADRLPSQVLETMAGIDDSSRPLLDDLAGAKAVVTTPSTVSLEAMALGRPVCHFLLDAECVLLNPPWSIRTPEDAVPALNDLVHPAELKLQFQDMMLDENLLFDGSASDRVVSLMLQKGAQPS